MSEYNLLKKVWAFEYDHLKETIRGKERAVRRDVRNGSGFEKKKRHRDDRKRKVDATGRDADPGKCLWRRASEETIDRQAHTRDTRVLIAWAPRPSYTAGRIIFIIAPAPGWHRQRPAEAGQSRIGYVSRARPGNLSTDRNPDYQS